MLREFDAHTTNAKANPAPPNPLSETGLEGSDSEDNPVPVAPPPLPNPVQANSLTLTEGDGRRGLGAIFYNRNFLTLWLGQLFSQLADKIYLVLIIAIISTRFETPGQTISGWVSAVMIAFTVPAVLFGAVAGVFVDRWPKKSVLVLSNLLRGGLVMLLPLGLWLTSAWGSLAGWPVAFELLLVTTFLVSTLTQFFAPAEQAVIPVIVNETDLLSANSLYTTTMMASVIIGFAVGEPLMALADQVMSFLGFTSHGPALLVGLSYLLAGLCLLLLVPGQEVLARNRHLSEVWTDIRGGLAYLRDHAQVRVAIVQLVLLSCVFAALAVLAVRLAETIPALKASQFGFLLAAGGLGLTLGALWVGHFGQRFLRRFLSLCGTLGMALCLIALAWTTQQLWLSLALIATLGLCGAFVGIPMQTLIQETTPEAMRGKVFGLQNNLVNIALTLPLALASVIETQVGLGNVFIGLGVLVGVGGVVTWYIADTALR